METSPICFLLSNCASLAARRFLKCRRIKKRAIARIRRRLPSAASTGTKMLRALELAVRDCDAEASCTRSSRHTPKEGTGSSPPVQLAATHILFDRTDLESHERHWLAEEPKQVAQEEEQDWHPDEVRYWPLSHIERQVPPDTMERDDGHAVQESKLPLQDAQSREHARQVPFARKEPAEQLVA
jgi:hypothetical protein